MFGKFFSGAFGLLFGLLMAVTTFIFVIGTLVVFVKGSAERERQKQKKKCLHCKEKRKNRILVKSKYPLKKLCDDCKERTKRKLEQDEDDEEEDDEDNEEEGTTVNLSIVKITKNGKTTTIINGEKVK